MKLILAGVLAIVGFALIASPAMALDDCECKCKSKEEHVRKEKERHANEGGPKPDRPKCDKEHKEAGEREKCDKEHGEVRKCGRDIKKMFEELCRRKDSKPDFVERELKEHFKSHSDGQCHCTCEHTRQERAKKEVQHRRDGDKGNNGVGNGFDPQPPGDPKVNDGRGTDKGAPGSKGGAKR